MCSQYNTELSCPALCWCLPWIRVAPGASAEALQTWWFARFFLVSFPGSFYRRFGWLVLPSGLVCIVPWDHLGFSVWISVVTSLNLCFLIILLGFLGKNLSVNNNFVFSQESNTTPI